MGDDDEHAKCFLLIKKTIYAPITQLIKTVTDVHIGNIFVLCYC